jgi:hypothetical protein
MELSTCRVPSLHDGETERLLTMKLHGWFIKTIAALVAVAFLGITGLSLNRPNALAIVGDFNGPTIESFTFSPTTIDISNSSASVVFTAHVTDASGVNSIPIALINNPANVSGTQQTGQYVRTSGTAQDGIYKVTITIPCGKQPGQWNVSSNQFYDTESNSSVWPVYPDNDQKLTVVNTGGICPIVTTSTVSSSVPVGLTMPTVAVTTPTVSSSVPVASTTPATKPILTVKKTLSAKSIATYTGLNIVTGSKVSMTVNATSRKTCRVSGTTLKAVKKGTCRVTVTVKSRTGKKSSKNLTLIVRS